MEVTNKQNLPEGIVRAVSREQHNKSDKELSATTLLKGIKEIILTRRHWEELTVDAVDRIWAIWGEAVHALLQTEGKTEFSEVDIQAEFEGLTITGRLDNYDMETGNITDYKTASVWKVIIAGDFEDWIRQGNIYAWLLAKNNFKYGDCRFIALLKDHSKSKARFDANYPKSPVTNVEFHVTSEDLARTEAFIKERVTDYQKYMKLGDDDIPPCTDEERWASATEYAVMKTGRKTAIKKFTSKADADQMAAGLGAGHYVETRPGVSRKCADYCDCKDFCNFYNNFVKAQQPSEE